MGSILFLPLLLLLHLLHHHIGELLLAHRLWVLVKIINPLYTTTLLYNEPIKDHLLCVCSSGTRAEMPSTATG